VDRKVNNYPVVALLVCDDGSESMLEYSEYGYLINGNTSVADLIEQPEEHTIDVWVAVYKREGKYKDSVEIFHSSNEQDVKDYAYHRGFGVKAMKKFTLTLKEGEME